MLDVHSSTLDYIVLSANWYGEIPDLRHFTELLEFRTTFPWLFEIEPEEAASKLSAPLLEDLIIFYDGDDTQQEFEDEHFTWLERFVVSYRSLMPVGGIKEVDLWDVQCEYENGNKALRDTRDCLKQHQIDFTWSTNIDELEIDESDPLYEGKSAKSSSSEGSDDSEESDESDGES